MSRLNFYFVRVSTRRPSVSVCFMAVVSMSAAGCREQTVDKPLKFNLVRTRFCALTTTMETCKFLLVNIYICACIF